MVGFREGCGFYLKGGGPRRACQGRGRSVGITASLFHAGVAPERKELTCGVELSVRARMRAGRAGWRARVAAGMRARAGGSGRA